MDSPNRHLKTFTVLVGVDYSDLSALALIQAVAIGRPRERSHVHVVHAVHFARTAGLSSGSGDTQPETVTTQTSEELRKFVEKVLAQPHEELPDDGNPLIERLTTHVRLAAPAEAIAQLASDIEADLVVVGTHGRRGLARLLGSVAEGVVRLAPCPVLVVRPLGTAIPKIEPPCPACLEARQATDGKEFWCAQHRGHHERAHTYHFGPVRSGHQAGLLIPRFR